LHLICSLISITVKVDYFLLLRKDVFHVLWWEKMGFENKAAMQISHYR
jgi:hypothetical protein